MKRTDLAYLAGLIDGEGCIRIKKCKPYRCQGRVTPGYHPAIQVRMVDEHAIRFLAETLGGWYYKEKPHSNNGRPLFCYQATDSRAEAIIKAVRPFLRVKAAVADVVLGLALLKKESPKHRTKVVGWRNFPNAYGTPRRVANKCLSDEFVGRCEAAFLRAKSLNRVGV